MNELDYNLIQQKVLHHTGAGDDYQEVFLSGMQFSESALTASIAENVADIYQDMKDMVMSFRTLDEEVMALALSERHNNFTHSWGQKVVNSLRAIHNLIYGESSAEEGSKTEKKQVDNLKNKNMKPDWLNERFSNQGE